MFSNFNKYLKSLGIKSSIQVHGGIPYWSSIPEGEHCPKCKGTTANSIHGRCTECGFQRHYSKALARRQCLASAKYD